MDISLYFRDKEREREERADVDMIAETLLVLPYTSRKEGGGERSRQAGRKREEEILSHTETEREREAGRQEDKQKEERLSQRNSDR